ncbi:hypothetical protein B0T24DRAFT_224274 [Lasiosphaeria ovina]|uniref:Uncharacterized protein n=1 Tax=Lasiosphaeria ovina TaxID=92902 RepID=A0AAE0NAV7_9PEZI|nr:hypothetical protein B0T24DRAFT_224274 [Lasiosphaeria ovina]
MSCTAISGVAKGERGNAIASARQLSGPPRQDTSCGASSPIQVLYLYRPRAVVMSHLRCHPWSPRSASPYNPSRNSHASHPSHPTVPSLPLCRSSRWPGSTPAKTHVSGWDGVCWDPKTGAVAAGRAWIAPLFQLASPRVSRGTWIAEPTSVLLCALDRKLPGTSCMVHKTDRLTIYHTRSKLSKSENTYCGLGSCAARRGACITVENTGTVLVSSSKLATRCPRSRSAAFLRDPNLIV